MTPPDPRSAFLDSSGLLRLMSWLSPAFPVGGFSYSEGLEYAVEVGLLRDRATTLSWITAMLDAGGGWIDTVLFLAAHRAITAGDRDKLAMIVEWAAALRGSAETALSARAQGQAFLVTLCAAWPSPAIDAWLDILTPAPAYTVAVAAAAACGGIGEAAGAEAFLHCIAANLVSAAVRLIPLGQTDGQRLIAGLILKIPSIVERAGALPFEDIGTALPMVDWTSIKHETQYTRLFRS